MCPQVFVGLGTNLGNRWANLRTGVEGLRRHGLRPAALSSVWESEPIDSDTPLWFLNMAVKIETGEHPLDVLDALRDRSLAIDWGAGPGVGAELRSILEAALAQDPAQRTASAEAFADAIEARCDVAPHRDVARLVERVSADEVSELRRRVAGALRTEERLSDSRELGPSVSPADAPPPVDALGTTAPGKVAPDRGAQATRPGRRKARPAAPSEPAAPSAPPADGARDTIADETMSPLAGMGARDTLREEVRSPLGSLPPPRRAASGTPAPTPPPRGRAAWPAILATFTVGALLGWLVAELVF